MFTQVKNSFFVAALGLALVNIGQASEAGAAAFKAGNYQAALSAFTEEQKKGDTSLHLQYNIAVCYYRLGRYTEAKTSFLKLSKQPEWDELAYYNLGLIALAEKNTEEANRQFNKTLAVTQNEKLTRLAQTQIMALSKPKQSVAPVSAVAAQSDRQKPWLVLGSFTYGHSSNAANLADDLVQNTSDASDVFWQAMLYGQTYIDGKAGDGIKLYSLALNKKLQEFQSLDSDIFGIGLAREKIVGKAAVETGLQITHIDVGGADVAYQYQGKAAVKSAYQGVLLSAAYVPAFYKASEEYKQIEGWRHRLEFGSRYKMEDLTFKGIYRYDFNDREDLKSGNQFASYSPTEHSFELGVDWVVKKELGFGAALKYEDTQYEHDNVLRDIDGRTKQQQRESSTLSYDLSANYKLDAHWALNLTHKNYDQEDNFKLYSYDGTETSARLDYNF